MTAEPYKGRINSPCSACGDGDYAMEFHDHEREYQRQRNLLSFPARPSAKVGIVIPLDQLRDSMREFMAEIADDDNNIYAWPFETYLQWLRKKQETSYDGS